MSDHPLDADRLVPVRRSIALLLENSAGRLSSLPGQDPDRSLGIALRTVRSPLPRALGTKFSLVCDHRIALLARIGGGMIGAACIRACAVLGLLGYIAISLSTVPRAVDPFRSRSTVRAWLVAERDPAHV